MIRSFVLGTSVLAGLVLLSGCNQNTSSNQQPAGSPPASVAANGNPAAENAANLAPANNATAVANNDNGAPAPGELSTATQMYVQDVALSDMYEVQAGQIAAMRSQSPDVKQFARHLIDAHTQNLNQLKQLIAKEAPGFKPPTQLDQTHQALLDDLQAADDPMFDPRYVAQQADQHNQAMISMRSYIKAGDMPDFKTFAQQTVPIVTMHLQEINAIERAHHVRSGAQANNVGAGRTR
jgi:putative membrane protein